MSIKFEIINMSPVNTNSVLIENDGKCVIIDAWGTVSDWVDLLESRNLELVAIYTTHGHADHLSATMELAKKYNAPWFLNHNDLPLLIGADWLLEHFGLPPLPDEYREPENISAGDLQIFPNLSAQVLNTPGHSPGGVVMYFKDYNLLIAGDTVFQDCVGRYDLPLSNYDDLMNSVANIYDLNLPDETVVVHGHGPNTNIKWLKENNKYFKS